MLGGVIENGVKVLLVVMVDLSMFVFKVVGLLCVKSFMLIAAVLLTLFRVVVLWMFVVVEYVCVFLYVMLVYVFMLMVVLVYLYFKKWFIEKVEIEKVKSIRKMVKAKVKAAIIVFIGFVMGVSVKWVECFVVGMMSFELFMVLVMCLFDVIVIDLLSDFSYSSSSSYANDVSFTFIVVILVNYDFYFSSLLSVSVSVSLLGFIGVYDFEELYVNCEVLMGGYNID